MLWQPTPGGVEEWEGYGPNLAGQHEREVSEMRGKTRLFGKTFPAWIVAAGLIVAKSGAATGVVLAGRVTGTMTATVSQALTVAGGSLSGVDADLFTTSCWMSARMGPIR